MRRSLVRFAFLVASLVGAFAVEAVALASVPQPVTFLYDAGPVVGQPGDGGLLLMDGGATAVASQPYVARVYSDQYHQTPTCTAAGYGAAATIYASVAVYGSNDLLNWVNTGATKTLFVDAGFAFVSTVGFDMTSGYPFQELQVSNLGSDGGFITCTVYLQ